MIKMVKFELHFTTVGPVVAKVLAMKIPNRSAKL